MGKVYTSIDQLIGRTPLLEIAQIEKNDKLAARVLVKLEYFNPAGSVKDRIAKAMVDEAERTGKIAPRGLHHHRADLGQHRRRARQRRRRARL